MGGLPEGKRASRAGGIIGLFREVLDDPERAEALKSDLLRAGLRWKWIGTRKLPWDELLAFVRYIPRDSALARVIHGAENLDWDATTQMLANVYDAIQYQSYLIRYVFIEGNKAELPEPYPRPGVKKSQPAESWTGVARTIEEMDRLLGWS